MTHPYLDKNMYLPYELWYLIFNHLNQSDKQNVALSYELTKKDVAYQINVNLIAYNSYKNTIYRKNPIIKFIDNINTDLKKITKIEQKMERFSNLYILIIDNPNNINESYKYLQVILKSLNKRNKKKMECITNYLTRTINLRI